MQLSSLGWTPFFEEAFQPYQKSNYIPARVAVERREQYTLLTGTGAVIGRCSGRLLHRAAGPRGLPAVGDWVAVELQPGGATIHAVLPRRTLLSRKWAGTANREQVIAANVDLLFIVTGLDQNFSLRRIERYLVLAREGGVEPVVLLNKADLCERAHEKRTAVEAIAGGSRTLLLSALTGSGLEALQACLDPGRTVGLLGSSGVGKSTIVNHLLGETLQATAEVRTGDSKGRHTTTSRHLIPLPGGALLLDTPGMRELGLWQADKSLDASFTDVTELSGKCRFADCRHETEPGCAIRGAIESGLLCPDRLQSWRKLQREQNFAAGKRNSAPGRPGKRQTKRSLQRRQKHSRFRDDLSEFE